MGERLKQWAASLVVQIASDVLAAHPVGIDRSACAAESPWMKCKNLQLIRSHTWAKLALDDCEALLPLDTRHRLTSREDHDDHERLPGTTGSGQLHHRHPRQPLQLPRALEHAGDC